MCYQKFLHLKNLSQNMVFLNMYILKIQLFEIVISIFFNLKLFFNFYTPTCSHFVHKWVLHIIQQSTERSQQQGKFCNSIVSDIFYARKTALPNENTYRSFPQSHLLHYVCHLRRKLPGVPVWWHHCPLHPEDIATWKKP